MPIIRKVISVGDSKAVTIPPSWLKFIERQTGQVVTEVTVEVNGQLVIRPIIEKKGSPEVSCE